MLKKFGLLIGTLSVIFLASGCGKSGGTDAPAYIPSAAIPPYPGYSNCGPGMYNFGVGCVPYTGSVQTSCTAYGGQILINPLNTAQSVCRTLISVVNPGVSTMWTGTPYLYGYNNMAALNPTYYWDYTYMGSIPYLTGPTPLYGFSDTGIQLRAGDMLYYNGNVQYGKSGFFSCGSKQSGNTVFSATDGTEFFLLMNGTKQINNNGVLSVGFNITDTSYDCAEYTFTRFYIARCTDVSTGLPTLCW